MPKRTFDGDHSSLRVGNLDVEPLRFDIHSDDATIIRVPSLGILLEGDTVEDTITYSPNPITSRHTSPTSTACAVSSSSGSSPAMDRSRQSAPAATARG
jgi:hypothetical protein